MMTFVFGLILIIICVLSVTFYFNIKKLLKSSVEIFNDQQDNIKFVRPETLTWLRSRGFEFEGVYHFNELKSVIYLNTQDRCHYHMIFRNNVLHVREFITILNEESCLTTSNSKDALMLELPKGSFLQVYNFKEQGNLYEKHQSALGKISSIADKKFILQEKSLERFITDYIHRQCEQVLSKPFWPMLVLWYFFIKRNIGSGKLHGLEND